MDRDKGVGGKRTGGLVYPGAFVGYPTGGWSWNGPRINFGALVGVFFESNLIIPFYGTVSTAFGSTCACQNLLPVPVSINGGAAVHHVERGHTLRIGSRPARAPSPALLCPNNLAKNPFDVVFVFSQKRPVYPQVTGEDTAPSPATSRNLTRKKGQEG